ncbi:MAG: DEAD/DEAH box helicase [Bacteroidota bacterium]
MTFSPLEYELFHHNLHQVALKFGLVDEGPPALEEDTVCRLLNRAEEYSFEPTNEERYKSLLICALLWENKHEAWSALAPFISKILIRLGLTTSAKMVNWNKDLALFNSFGSLLEELCATVQLMDSEVSIADQKLTLSDFQKRMWDSIDQYSRVGISAPTSAGKSFVLVNKAIQTLINQDGKIFFIVPTISLITQVSNDIRKKLKELSIYNIEVAQTVNDISLFKSAKAIYVLTQERAFSAINHPDADFSDVRMLIVDEIQNIEKVANENEERAKILFDVIQIFKNDLNPDKIVLSGPRLDKLQGIMKKWFGDEARSVSEELPAVLNLTYSFKKGRGTLSFVQYISEDVYQSILVDDRFKVKAKMLDRQKFGTEENQLLAGIINSTKKEGNIIFADKSKSANEIARGIALLLNDNDLSPDTESFSAFIESTVHPKYELIQTVKKGIAYHHAKMPPHIRCLVEKLFIGKHLNTVVATTTLMQGVNLPAKNIIIKTPKVGLGELTGYEFSNLKGRAGRLMQDFVGRALIINEGACEEVGIKLGVSQQKELIIGYAGKFEMDKNVILDCLTNNKVMSNEVSNDIVTYIRNMVVRYGLSADIRLGEVGIVLDKAVIDSITAGLNNLEVPAIICRNNFYWDPLVLDQLYKQVKNDEWPDLPNTIIGSSGAIHECILKMAAFAPMYYARYIPKLEITEFSVRKVQSLSIYAESYGRGRPLKDVINPIGFPIESPEQIEERINDIQTKVVYGIPKLLKPLFQIYDLLKEQKTAAILSCIEVGGLEQRLRALIEIGIPRETAIALLQNDPDDKLIDADDRISETALKAFLRRAKASVHLNKWHKLIIHDIL